MPEFPIINVINIICARKQGYLFKDADVIKHVEGSKVPILFIHSNQDDYVPEYMAYKLYESANCEKDLWIVEGNNHGTLFFTNTEEYKTKIKEFYERYM